MFWEPVTPSSPRCWRSCAVCKVFWVAMWALGQTDGLHRLQKHFGKQKFSSWKNMGVNPQKIHPSTEWSETGCGTVQVSSVCHLHSSREMKLLTCNDNNCPMFYDYFYSSCLNFSWHMDGWKQRHRTLVWWGILQWEHMPRLPLDSRSPLIGITTILWQTLSYERPKLWAKKQVLVSCCSGAL